MLKYSSLSSDIFRNILWLLTEKVYFVALIFLSEAMISRTLGVTDYGKWIYSVNWIIVVSSIALVSGSEVVTPALSKHKKIINELISTTFIIRMFGAVLGFLFINTYSCFFITDHLIKRMFFFLSFILLLNEPFGVVINYYQSIIKIKKAVLCRCTGLAVRTIFVLLGAYTANSLYIYASRTAEALSLAFLLCIILLVSGFKISPNRRVFKIMLNRGFRLWLPLVIMMIYLRIDRFFIQNYLSYEALAIYGVAVQFLEQAFLLISIIIQSVAPRYIFSSIRKDQLQTNVKKTIQLVMGICICIQILCGIFLRPAITIIFGADYEHSATLALMLLPSILFYGVDLVLMQVMYRLRENKFILFKWTFMLIFSCVMYYLWLAIFHGKSITLVYNFNYLFMCSLTVLYYLFVVRKKL